jgi:hypothetical protein
LSSLGLPHRRAVLSVGWILTLPYGVYSSPRFIFCPSIAFKVCTFSRSNKNVEKFSLPSSSQKQEVDFN